MQAAGLAEAPGGEIDSWSSLARSAQGGSAAIYGGHWFSSIEHGRATAFGRQRGWAMAPFIGVCIILLVRNVGNGWEWGNGIVINIVIMDHSLIPCV